MDQTKFLSTKTQITNFHNHCEDNGCCLPSKQSYAVKFDAMGENNHHDPSWFSSEEREGNENGNAELTWLNHCDQILENIPSRPRPRLKGTLFFSSRRSLRNDIMKNRKGRGGGELLGSASRVILLDLLNTSEDSFQARRVNPLPRTQNHHRSF